MNPRRLLLALVTACRAVRADPPADAATSVDAAVVWRELSPGVRFAEARDTFLNESGAPRTSAWVVARIDLARARLAIVRSTNDRPDGVAPLDDVVFAVNAGFFQPGGAPSGLVASGGDVLGQPEARGGSGVLVVDDGRARLLPRESLDGGVAWHRAAIALQCGPRLIEADGSVGIYRDDGYRFARTVACIRDRGRTLDLIATWQVDDPLRGPGLWSLARRLAGRTPTGDPPCEAALNLDGGPSTGLVARDLRGAWRFARDPVGPTPWLLVARRPALAH